MGFPLVLFGDRKVHLVGGILVWLMHTFIFLIMKLSFESFKVAVFAFFMNIPYWIVRIYTRFNPRSSLLRNDSGAPVLGFVEKTPLPSLSPSSSSVSRLLFRVVTAARSTPCKTMIALLILCYLCQDRYYPFSSFPMYSQPKPYGHYTYVTGHKMLNNGTMANTTMTCQRWFKKTCSQFFKFMHSVCRGVYRRYLDSFFLLLLLLLLLLLQDYFPFLLSSSSLICHSSSSLSKASSS
jgi:hypothetical protein